MDGQLLEVIGATRHLGKSMSWALYGVPTMLGPERLAIVESTDSGGPSPRARILMVYCTPMPFLGALKLSSHLLSSSKCFMSSTISIR